MLTNLDLREKYLWQKKVSKKPKEEPAAKEEGKQQYPNNVKLSAESVDQSL